MRLLLSLLFVLFVVRPMAPGGMLVTRVIEGSAAAKAGLVRGDIVVSMNGRPVPSGETMEALIGNRVAADPISIGFTRKGVLQTIEVPYPSFDETGFGLRGIPEMPEDLAKQVEETRSPAVIAKLAETVNEPYLKGWLYLHAADLHDGNAVAYAKKGLALVRVEEDAAVCSMGLLIAMGDSATLDNMRAVARAMEAGQYRIYESGVLIGIASVELKDNHFDAALVTLTRAREILEQARPKSKSLADVYHGIGLVANMAGKFAIAEDMGLKAAEIREVTMPGSAELGASYADAGLAAAQRGDFRAGIYRLDKARAVLEKLPESADVLSIVYNNLGICYELSGDLKSAEKTFRTCIEMQQKSMPDSTTLAITEINIALVQLSLGKRSDAAGWARRAWKITQDKNPNSPQEAATLGVMGLIQLDANDLPSAQKSFSRAAALYERFAPDSVQLALVLGNQGMLAIRQTAIPKAKALFARALAITDANRQSIVSPEERVHLQEATFMLPRFYSRALAAGGDLVGAFLAIEASRGRALEDLMAERSVNLADGAPKELVAKQQLVTENLAGVKKQIEEAFAGIEKAKGTQDAAEVSRLGGQVKALRLKVRDQQERQKDLERQIRTVSPRFAALKYPMPLNKSELTAVLAPGDLVIAFNTMADVTQILTCSKGKDLQVKVTTVKMPLNRLRSLAIEFKQSIVNRTDSKPSGTALYKNLIEPVLGQIAACKHLIIMPDTCLDEVPFCAIPIGKGKTVSDLAPITYELSISLYRDLAKMPRAPGGFVGIAFPTKESEVRPVDTSSDLFRRSSRVILPGAGREVNMIASIVPASKVFLDQEATLSSVLPSLSKARYVHFACHGVVDSVSPLDSGLALCPEAGKDGLLLARDFLKLRLSADLVTLSACESGRGAQTFSEGLTGFARALHYAGARSVLVTLWPIEDESTALFMQTFYRKLSAGATKDVAVNAGIASLKANPKFSDPRFWAPFVLSGAYR